MKIFLAYLFEIDVFFMSVILVTGGLGFIGSEVVRKLIKDTDHKVVVIDKLNYC